MAPQRNPKRRNRKWEPTWNPTWNHKETLENSKWDPKDTRNEILKKHQMKP